MIQLGERRWRAAQPAGLAEIPAIVIPAKQTSDKDRLIRALVENLQREDLNPIDEAQAFQRLAEAGLSNTEIARQCGVSSHRIAARLILLELDPEIQQFLASGQLHKDPRVARALLDIPDREVRVRYATEAARRRFSIQGILIGSRRIAALVEAQELERGKTPSLAFAVHRRAAEWNLIRQVELDLGSRMPSWETVKLAAGAPGAPRWGAWEDEFVQANLGLLSLDAIGRRLGRSANAIKIRQVRQGWRAPSRREGWLTGPPAVGFRPGEGNATL